MPLLGLVLVLALAGCGTSTVQGAKYAAFKTATVALAAEAQTNYAGVESLWEELNAQCLAMPGNGASYKNLLSGQGIPCGKDGSGEVRRFDDPRPVLDVRLKAIHALVNYAALLNTLATTDYAGGVTASTAKLTASLESLQASLTPQVPEAQKIQEATTLLGSVVKAAGGLYVDNERKMALRKVLKETQASIATLAERLLRDNVHVVSFTRADLEFFVGEAGRQRPADYEKRMAYDAKVLQRYKTGTSLIAALRAQDKAVQALPEAHAELLESLDKPDAPLERLEAFVAATEQALIIAQQINKI
jgi:hypothetical protein